MVEPALAAGQPRVRRPLRMADDLGQTLEVVLPPDLDDEPAVAARNPWLISGPVSPFLRPIDQKLDTMSVMAITESNMATSTYCGWSVRSRSRRAARMPTVANKAAPMSPRPPTGETIGRLVRQALHLVDARHRLDDRGEGRPVPVGGRGHVSEPRHRDVDTAGWTAHEVLEAEAEPLHGPGPEVLGDHVEARGHVEHELAPRGVLEVDADAALAEVVAQEGGAHRAPVGIGYRRLRGCGPALHRAAPPSPRRHRGGASSCVANGNACICSRAKTRMPVSGPDDRRSEGSATTSTIFVYGI